MKKDYVEIAFILDRSGSMQSLKEFAIKGFNDFIAEQKNVLVNKEVKFSLVLFDHQYTKHFDAIPLNDTPEINTSVYVPRGLTALLDAIGKTVTDLGVTLDNLSEDDKPEKVIIVIMTDGQENNSREYTPAQIKELIKTQEDSYNWSFMYLSSDLNSVHDAVHKYGLNLNSVYAYNATADGYDMKNRDSGFYGAGRFLYSAINDVKPIEGKDPNGNG